MKNYATMHATSESQAHAAIAMAFAAAARDTSRATSVAAAISSLTTSLGNFIPDAIALIKSGISEIPTLLADLTADGVTLPSWATLVLQILVQLVAVAS